MAIKKLQNNFTSVEQSKRLLELGVPADSADCCGQILDGDYSRVCRRETEKELSNDFFTECDYIQPCWSVGRLIEIYEKCVGERFERHIDPATLLLKPLLEDVLSQIDEHTKMVYRNIDFSKLEEAICSTSAKRPCRR